MRGLVKHYIPERGDLVWLSFGPQAEREQAGRRPGVILSPAAYNRKSGLALVCPITSKAKGYPFEVALPECLAVSGVVLADHVRSIDWAARQVEFAGTVPLNVIQTVFERLQVLIE
jgi:Growth inhibitor